MNCGILDIGTNTVHGAIYKIDGGKFRKADSLALASPVLSYTQKKQLTETGITALTETIQVLLKWFADNKINTIHAFATASLRGLENASAVQTAVAEKTGVSIRILSGAQEAECDFLAIQDAVKAEEGIGFDLGGGSMQVVQFAENQLQYAKSLPTGTNRFWRRFVKGARATEKELETMFREAAVEISVLPDLQIKRLYAMGGTAKRAAKIMALLTGEKKNVLQITELQKLSAMPEFLETTAKDRAKTLTSGIVILSALCQHFEAEELEVLSCGVREGYLQKLLKENSKL